MIERRFVLASGSEHVATMRDDGSVFVHGVGEHRDWWSVMEHFTLEICDPIQTWTDAPRGGER